VHVTEQKAQESFPYVDGFTVKDTTGAGFLVKLILSFMIAP
jgi:hypothetical protein